MASKISFPGITADNWVECIISRWKEISFLHIAYLLFYYRYVESKPLFHMFGEEPDPSLHAKLMASSDENQDVH